MKKWFLLVACFAILAGLVLGGCAPTVAPEELAKAKSELANDLNAAKKDLDATKASLAAAQNQIKALQGNVSTLCAMTAYGIWYDRYYTYYYYGYGTYNFNSYDEFVKKLGGLINGTGDSNSIKAWDTYVKAANDWTTFYKAQPEDYTKWKKEDTEKSVKMYNDSWTTLGNVGTQLYTLVYGKVPETKK